MPGIDLDDTLTPATARPTGTSDFSIYTASMELGTQHGAPIVSMVGSSTIRDLKGDVMLESALADMSRVQPGLLIWMNHSYDLPDDLFGSLTKSPHMSYEAGIADLHITSDVERSNPAAARTYSYIEKGRKLGCSIGCRVDKAAIDEELYERTGEVALLIESVTTIEWSVVGVPCNQRSWVESAIKGYGLRTLSNPGTADMRVARLVKTLFPKDYDRLARSVTHDNLRKSLWEAETLPTPPARFIWDPGTRDFFVKRGAAPEQRLDREDVAAQLTQGVASTATRPPAPIPPAAPTPAAPIIPVIPLTPEAIALTKAAEDKDHKAQAARSRKYGISVKKGGNVTKPGKWSSVPDSQWGDPVNYRYPMKDKAHARNALSRWGDAGNRSQYSKGEQSIVGGRIRRRAKALGVSVSDGDGK